MDLKDSKGEGKDANWTPFYCLVEAAVAAAGEELQKEERLIKETMSHKEGLKIDNAVNNSPDFFEKPLVQPNIGIFGPQPTGLPERLKEMIKGMEGTDEKLIIQKPLFKTDRSKHHGRLSIPMNQVKVEFLTDEEKNVLKNGSNEKKLVGIEALVIEPCLPRDMVFKRWDMKKPSGKTCSIYVLSRGWNSVVKDNDMKVDDVIQL